MKKNKMNLAAATMLLVFLLNASHLIAGGNPVAEKSAEPAAALKVDPARSQLIWTARKVGGEHTGTVSIAEGTLLVEGSQLQGGEFVMDMTSITNTDITNEMMNSKLTDHLKSEDFFAVAKYPSSTFTISSAKPVAGAAAGQPNYTISGKLTIKGITKTVTFPATVKITDNTAEAVASFDVDRTLWDIKYRAAIIGTAADKIIDDHFTIALKVVSQR